MPVDTAPALLAWYDIHARRLPWRSPPGTPRADPYRVWLSEIMLQQTTVAAVKPYFERFTARWPDVSALAAADEDELMAAWAGLGYYARARNLLACARVVAALGGFPETEAALRALPGIGAYTAAAIAAIAFGEAAAVLDGNVERVMARLHAVETPLPAARPLLRAHVAALVPAGRPGDFAQATMDLGATICTPRKPACGICPVRETCAGFATGDPARYPLKAARQPRPDRFGTAFWLERDGAVLLVRRPGKGLLGGMRVLPTGPWADAPPGLADAPVPAAWTLHDGGIVHVFTHFRLTLALATARLGAGDPAGEWWPIDRIGEAGLPTVFAKAAAARGLPAAPHSPTDRRAPGKNVSEDRP
ncbi:MAG: A/G-specific adenine glycosylase [Sphingomonas sp.]